MADTMRNRTVARSYGRAVAVTLAAVALSGCATGGGLFSRGGGGSGADGTDAGAAVQPNLQAALDADGLEAYLLVLRQLIEGDTLTQAAIVNELRDGAEFAPTKQNRLAYALVLATPGHNGSDPIEGARRLRVLIASGSTLTAEERVLAQIQLQTAARLEVLQAAALESDTDLERALATRDEAHAAELARARAETAAVRAELQAEIEEMSALLEAISNIERSISEREDDE